MEPPDKINILLVDDQPAKLLGYEVILEELGENLLKATSADEALSSLLKNEIAVVLIDVCMPELDGFELAAMIRGHPRYRETSIIFVSAVMLDNPAQLRGYEAGAVDYVPVPVVPELLRAKVRVFADLYRKTRQLEQLNVDLEKRVAERTAALEQSTLELRELNDELERRVEVATQEREVVLAQLFEAQKLDTIGQLTGSVAHDFNNLLMVILSSLQMLQKRLPADERIGKLLQNAVQGAERGAALTQRLLAFARRQELKPTVVDAVKVLTGMEGLLRRALGPQVEIQNNLPDLLPLILIDSNQFELAILNLAVNARDAMPGGGIVKISATAVSVRTGDKNVGLIPGDYVRITLADTGIGMDAETLARAVEPFYTTKGLGKGTGLGLSMVQGLAAQSGGMLRLRSEVGNGCEAELWLPCSHGAAPAENAREPARPFAENCRVLVVDDDELVCIGTVGMLEDMGHVAIECHSGAEALAKLSEGLSVDLVVTDYAMPGMTGLQLIDQIRSLKPNLPIILATGYAEFPSDASPPNLQRLSKPFAERDLAAAITSVLAMEADQVMTVPSSTPDRSAISSKSVAER